MLSSQNLGTISTFKKGIIKSQKLFIEIETPLILLLS